MTMGIILYLTLLTVVFKNIESTISPGDKSKQQIKSKNGPQEVDVFQSNLVVNEPLAQDILVYNSAYYKDVSLRRFNGTVLGYVTAWNSHGYDIAKTFAKKFDIISPVWFQVIKAGDEYVLAGTHDIDNSWIKDVRRKSKTNRGTAKIFPRIIFDKFTERDFSKLLSFERERQKVNELLVETCMVHNFDGVVLEFWAQLVGRVDDIFLENLVIEMTKAFQKQGLRVILVIPPMREGLPNVFSEKHMDNLYKHVYAFSLMTYDYSSFQRPGANAPLHWIKRSIENIVPENCHDVKSKRRKLLMGLNMYGNDFTPDGGKSIIAEDYLKLVKNLKKRLAYDERNVENYFEIRTKNGRHYVFYPTLFSINERIQLAQEMGVGISIWELGQGLDYFYDLF